MDGKFPIDAERRTPERQIVHFARRAEVDSARGQGRIREGSDGEIVDLRAGPRAGTITTGPLVQSILAERLAADGYRFSALVRGIVESMPFQMRRGEGPRS